MTMLFACVTIIPLLTIVIYLIAFYKWKFSYWRRRNVPYIQPEFPLGTIQNPFNKKHHNVVMYQQQYHHLKSLGCKYGGLYTFIIPGLLLIDREVIKCVFSKDFQYFPGRGFYQNEKDDPLSANLFLLEGQPWRNLRVKLTPTYTSGKIKMMFPTLVACTNPLSRALSKCTSIDVKDLAARYTTDVIGSCAFGIECNSFKEPEDHFQKYGRILFDRRTKLQSVLFLVASVNPRLGRLLGITKINSESRRFFLSTVRETVEYRKRNNIVRNDFLQLLIDLLTENDKPDESTILQIAAQVFIFFLAGFETSSTTMTFCLFELAVNQEIQRKVRNEINTVLAKYQGNITYDAITEMSYLNSVIDETLRKYPPLATLQRVCAQNYKIPETDNVIEKGTRVLIPVYALHHDPEYFSNPEEFDPDRFKLNIPPFAYLPFGEGPRICIAQRFGLLQTKVGLAVLLRNTKFVLNKKMKNPIEFNRSAFLLNPKGGVWLDIENIS